MQDLIWLLPTYPVLGFFTLVLTAGRLPKNIVAIIGAGSVGLSFFTAVIIATQFLSSGENYFIKEVWTWMAVGNFSPGFNFYLDGLSLVMMLVITGVGFLIHLYARFLQCKCNIHPIYQMKSLESQQICKVSYYKIQHLLYVLK